MHRIASFLLVAATAFGADAIYINGTVISVDPAKFYAEASAATNSRFSAIGSNAEIRRVARPGTVVDLKGMTVTPGFNDVHLRPAGVYDESLALVHVGLRVPQRRDPEFL
jgi:predicted amidohydrolase YtcJ